MSIISVYQHNNYKIDIKSKETEETVNNKLFFISNAWCLNSASIFTTRNDWLIIKYLYTQKPITNG